MSERGAAGRVARYWDQNRDKVKDPTYWMAHPLCRQAIKNYSRLPPLASRVRRRARRGAQVMRSRWRRFRESAPKLGRYLRFGRRPPRPDTR